MAFLDPGWGVGRVRRIYISDTILYERKFKKINEPQHTIIQYWPQMTELTLLSIMLRNTNRGPMQYLANPADEANALQGPPLTDI